MAILRKEVAMFDLERFLTFARDRLAETDEALPCEPEDCAAIMSYLCALVPEYNLACQVEADSDVERRADRKRALVDGFRRARGAAPVVRNESGNDNEGGNGSVNRATEVA
jgi:hypothetical protein